jgi:hypothetical protein
MTISHEIAKAVFDEIERHQLTREPLVLAKIEAVVKQVLSCHYNDKIELSAERLGKSFTCETDEKTTAPDSVLNLDLSSEITRAYTEAKRQQANGLNYISDIMRGTSAEPDKPLWKTDPWTHEAPAGWSIPVSGFDLFRKGLPQYGQWICDRYPGDELAMRRIS